MGISGSSTVGQYRRDPGEGEVGCSWGRKTGAWALPLVSCLRHPLTWADTRFIPVFDICSVTLRQKMPPWEQRLLWEGGPAPRGTGYLALQPHPSRMRKYWICFLKGKKKIQYSVCDARLRAWLWQENAVNLPFPHQLLKKDPFSLNILIFSPGLNPTVSQVSPESLC